MSLRTFKTLVKENKAPRGAKYIGIFKKNEETLQEIKRIDITGTGLEDKTDDEPLYSFGVLSDVHMRASTAQTDVYYEGKTEAQVDFENAIRCFENSGVSFVCVCGDWGIESIKDKYDNDKLSDADWELVRNKLSDTGITIPILTCLGNHDCIDSAFHPSNNDEKLWINKYWLPFMFYTNKDRNVNMEDIFDDTGDTGEICFQKMSANTENDESDGCITVWDKQNGFATIDENGGGIRIDGDTGTTVPVTGSFYFVKTNTNGKNDVFIFFSLFDQYYYESDYTNYKNLNWLRKILERHKNDRCFVFTHFPFGRKAGNLYGAKKENGTDSRIGDKIYNRDFTLVPNNWDPNRKKEWVRLNVLNNYYKNSVWFSGHTHYKWKYQKYYRLTNVRNSDPGYHIDNESDPKSLPPTESAYNVHLPSCAYPREVVDVDNNSNEIGGKGNRYDDWNDSEGAIVKVYKDRIEVLGVSFKTGAGVDEGDSVYPGRQWGGPENDNRNKNWKDLYHNKMAPIAKYTIPTNTVNFTGETTDVFETNAEYISKFDN